MNLEASSVVDLKLGVYLEEEIPVFFGDRPFQVLSRESLGGVFSRLPTKKLLS